MALRHAPRPVFAVAVAVTALIDAARSQTHHARPGTHPEGIRIRIADLRSMLHCADLSQEDVLELHLAAIGPGPRQVIAGGSARWAPEWYWCLSLPDDGSIAVVSLRSELSRSLPIVGGDVVVKFDYAVLKAAALHRLRCFFFGLMPLRGVLLLLMNAVILRQRVLFCLHHFQ